MKTSRTDVERNKKQIICPKSTLLGFSSGILQYGDLFLYVGNFAEETGQKRLGKCHGQIKPREGNKWFILTQTASENCQFSYERWICPDSVCETIPKKRANKHIMEFFEETEDYFVE